MADAPTLTELTTIAEAALRAELDPSGISPPDLSDGSRLTALVGLQVGMASRLSLTVAQRDAAARVSSAQGADLTELGADVYTLPRKAPQFTTGRIALVRGAGRPATSIPAGTRFAGRNDDGKVLTYAVPAAVSVLSNATTVELDLRATEAGRDHNITQASDVDTIVDALPDTAWAITTPPAGAVFGGGDAAEEDEVYRARLLRVSPEQVRVRGTYDAVVAGVLATQGVRYAVVIEPGNGSLVIFAGDLNYVLTAAMRADIAKVLRGWRCLGVPPDIRPFSVGDTSIAATIYMRTPLADHDLDSLRAAAVRSVVRYFEQRAYADEFYLSMIEAALAAPSDATQDVTVTLPAADIVRHPESYYASLPAMQVYRVRESNVSITFAPPRTA